MDLMTSKRIDQLDALTKCPVCGSARSQALGGRKNRKVFFACGSTFYCHPGAPIGSMLPCPAPTDTAATLLELEIVERDHLALAKAGAA
ncbi:hypothetical protein AX761_21980 [Rhizobium sp. 58]|nr:hypothetical protein AX761_21980 [Rhizobium sp. 58]